MPNVTYPVSAAVLAGGLSRRMGQDKALLTLEGDNVPLIERVLERVRAVADDVTIIASDRDHYAAFGADIVPDAYPGTGTLGGIATALRAARHERCLVVPCDLPFLNARLLAEMTHRSGDWDVLAPRISGESRQGRGQIVQTLHAVYGKRCLPTIERRLEAGQLKVIGFFDDVEVAYIEEGEVRRFDPHLLTFFNANTPEAAAEAGRLLAGRG